MSCGPSVASRTQATAMPRRRCTFTGINFPRIHADPPASELTAFRTGFEYIVAHARAPDVFVIHQRPVVRDGSRGPVSHAYFIIQDKIYMAPNLHDVAAMRLRNALHLVERTFDALERARPSANPRAGAAWRAIPKTEKEKNKDKKDGEGDEGAGGKDGDGDATMDEATGTPAAKGKDVSSNDKEADDIASVGSGSGSASASKQAGPDWHLFHALASTRAALGDLDALAAAPAPLYDTFAEARALEAAALASLGRVPQQPQQLQQQQQPQQQQLAGPGGGLGLTPAGTAAPTPLGRRMSTLAPSLAGESPVA